MTAILELEKINHCYTVGTAVLRDLSLTVCEGEIACLLGPSGCGKTTALRIVAGFEKPVSGAVKLAGGAVNGPGLFLPPERRSVGVVFQDAALFPHMSVAKNIAFGLRGVDRAARAERVDFLLNLMALQGQGPKFPHQLSGGQRQRVALARAMAPRPKIILLDEPFANLDAELSRKLSAQVRTILKENGMTAILVTHDQQEAFTMADRIAVLNQGGICQEGTARELFHKPKDLFVAGFVGDGSFIEGHSDGSGGLNCIFGRLRSREPGLAAGRVRILVRPEMPTRCDDGVEAEVRTVLFRGSYSLYVLRLANGEEIKAGFSGTATLAIGERIQMSLPDEGLSAFAWEP